MGSRTKTVVGRPLIENAKVIRRITNPPAAECLRSPLANSFMCGWLQVLVSVEEHTKAKKVPAHFGCFGVPAYVCLLH